MASKPGHGRRARDSNVSAAFGSRLRAARRGQSLTLKELSDRSGSSVAYLSDLERGLLRNPTLETLTGLATALSVSLNELLGIAAEPCDPPPGALADFASLPQFLDAVSAEAKRRRLSEDSLREEWLRCLGAVSIYGDRPATESDYLFLWEAIRRVLPG